MRKNRERIQRKEVTVLATYETLSQAREVARYYAKKREPTLNAGWLQVHIAEVPPQSEAAGLPRAQAGSHS